MARWNEQGEVEKKTRELMEEQAEIERRRLEHERYGKELDANGIIDFDNDNMDLYDQILAVSDEYDRAETEFEEWGIRNDGREESLTYYNEYRYLTRHEFGYDRAEYGIDGDIDGYREPESDPMRDYLGENAIDDDYYYADKTYERDARLGDTYELEVRLEEGDVSVLSEMSLEEQMEHADIIVEIVDQEPEALQYVYDDVQAAHPEIPETAMNAAPEEAVKFVSEGARRQGPSLNIMCEKAEEKIRADRSPDKSDLTDKTSRWIVNNDDSDRSKRLV